MSKMNGYKNIHIMGPKNYSTNHLEQQIEQVMQKSTKRITALKISKSQSQKPLMNLGKQVTIYHSN